jgi:hypothetical protein
MRRKREPRQKFTGSLAFDTYAIREESEESDYNQYLKQIKNK